MGLFNKYFGSNDQPDNNEISVQQVMKFIRDLSPIIDSNLLSKYEHDYYDGSWSEDEINQEELKEFRTNILVHMIFGIVHNEFFNIQEKFVNMTSSHKDSLYTKSYWALCSHWATKWRVVDEIIKTTDIQYDERSILVIALYAQDIVYRWDIYLTWGVEECIDNKYAVEEISSFKALHFLFYNPQERYTPLEFDYDDDYDLKAVNIFARSVMAVYHHAKKLINNGN